MFGVIMSVYVKLCRYTNMLFAWRKNMNRKESNQSYAVDLDKAVDVYSDMVLRVAITYTKNMTDAQDIYQETFLRLVKYKDTILSEAHLKAWLIRVATNCAKTFLTSSWNKNTEGLDENIAEKEVFYFNDESDNSLYEAIVELPEKYKVPLYMFYYEGYPINQIAEMLDKNENSVKTLLKRGREKLKNVLSKEGYNG